MNFDELVARHALRNNYTSVVKILMPTLSKEMHLELAFFIMRHIVRHRKYASYLIVRELAKELRQYELPSTSHECDVYRIECAAAFIILMNGIIASRNNPRERANIISTFGELLSSTGKFEELDAEIRKSRVTLLAVSMKDHRIGRLQREFENKADRISAQMEKHLDILQLDLLPPLERFPLERWAQSDVPQEVALADIIASNGLQEESLMKYFEIVQNTPSLSVDFFRSSSGDLFTEEEELPKHIVIE